MPHLHLVLAEAAIEPVPEDLWSHPSVSKHAKTRSKRPMQLLLDDTYHHAAMRKAAQADRFEDIERRGRPDIVHTTLLVALESRLNKDGRLRIWIHTRNDELVQIDPTLRMQRAQHRFYGLLEQLFEHGSVPPDAPEPLMAIERGVDLAEALRRTGAARVIVMDEAGDDVELEGLFATADGDATTHPDTPLPHASADVAVVVGGFPAGTIQSDLRSVSHVRVALGKEPLTAWSVVGDVVTRFRLATGNVE